MRDRGETEAYLAAELDSLQQAYAAGDQAAVTRRIKHVSDESGQETAAVLEQMLKEREALRPPLARPTTQTAPQDGVHKLPPPRSRKLVVAFLTVTVVALLLVIAVLVTVIIVRPSTTTTMPFPMQATGHPAETTAPPSTSTETTTTTVPIPVEPSEQKWTPVWPGLRQLTMPPKSRQQ